MSECTKELLEIIDKQMKIYNDLLALSRNKSKVIIEGKVKELDNITKIEQGMIVEIGKLENNRIEVSSNVFRELGLQPTSTMADIADSLESDMKNKFTSVREQIAKVLEELSSVNKHNGKLIMQSLEYIEFNINMVSGASANDNTYDANVTSRGNTQNKKLFDVKI